MAQLRWLHLSDFHVGKDQYGQRKMFRAILNHVRERMDSNREPNFVFITGDLANSGDLREYEEFAEGFLFPLSELLGPAADRRVYCIPGNHDVDRTKAPFISREIIYKRSKDFLDPTPKGASLREHILARFAGFMEYDLTNPGPHWLKSDDGAFCELRKVGDISIGIVGLNTAWHSEDKEDEGQLMAGADILEASLARLQGADVYIVLGHHPIDNLLGADAQAIRVILARHGALYLHGHYHRTETRIEYGSGRLFRTFQSGACFQERDDELWQNRILWCEIDWLGQALIAEPFTWVDSAREWRLDGRAFPEASRLPESARWSFPLPASKEAATKDMGPSTTSPPAGWELISRQGLFGKARVISDDELIRFFDGRAPDWPIALSQRVPRRNIVSEIGETIRLALESPGPTLCVVLGAGGEGKTTATIQAAASLLSSDDIDAILWRSSSSASFDPHFIKTVHGKRVAVVVDDGHNIASALSDYLTSQRGKRDDVLYLLCSRDTDWIGAGATRIDWQSICKFNVFKLRGLSREDAQLIIGAWGALGDRGLGQLKRMETDAAVDELLRGAREEAYFDEGAFLGALLRTRIGAGLRDHIKSLLARFGERSVGKRRRLIDAFAYICAVHSEGLDILTDEILGWTMDLSVGDLRKSVIAPLGEEAAATIHGSLVVSRHREIAREAISILTEERGYYLAGLFQDILLAADRAANEGHFVAKLRNWRFGLVDHFLDSGRFDVGQSLARALVTQNPTNPFFATKFSQALRLAGETIEAGRFMEGAVLRVSLGRDGTRSFYNEWATAFTESGQPALAAWLAGIVLSDLNGIPFDHANIKLAWRTFWPAVEKIEQERGSGGSAENDRLDLVRARVKDAWRYRERDLPALVPDGDSLSFESLKGWIDRNWL